VSEQYWLVIAVLLAQSSHGTALDIVAEKVTGIKCQKIADSDKEIEIFYK